MASKIRLTRPELKKQRDSLRRFERYLPMLKLKQQQLQLMLRQIDDKISAARQMVEAAKEKVAPYRRLMNDFGGVDIGKLSSPQRLATSSANIAGVWLPVLDEVIFPPMDYSLFATPPWVDRAITDGREISRRQAELDILLEESRLLTTELNRVTQRVNLFEKVMIPQAIEAIRRIRIRLGDEMTAAVGRAKIAKGKLTRHAQAGELVAAAMTDQPEAVQ